MIRLLLLGVAALPRFGHERPVHEIPEMFGRAKSEQSQGTGERAGDEKLKVLLRAGDAQVGTGGCGVGFYAAVAGKLDDDDITKEYARVREKQKKRLASVHAMFLLDQDGE